MHKSYSINQSPLYSIRGLNQLEKKLNINLDKIDKLKSPESYRVWINEKGREIQRPVGWLESIHKNIAFLLSRIEMPEYVFCKKGKSYVDNAHQHIGYHLLSKTDISKFYPSTTHQMVKAMFVNHFKCAKDVASYLADICCYRQNQLPTGSPISGYIAFFASKSLFDDVEKYAKSNGCNFTLYVDDLTISGTAASGKLINKVRLMIRNHGLKAKRTKTKTYSAYVPKEVTGNLLKGNQQLLPNRRHMHIYETRQKLLMETDPKSIRHLHNVLKGQLREYQQIKNVNDGTKLEAELQTRLIFA